FLQSDTVQFQRRKLPRHVIWIEENVDAGQLADRLINRLAVAGDVHVDREVVNWGQLNWSLCLLDALAEDILALWFLLSCVSRSSCGIDLGLSAGDLLLGNEAGGVDLRCCLEFLKSFLKIAALAQLLTALYMNSRCLEL